MPKVETKFSDPLAEALEAAGVAALVLKPRWKGGEVRGLLVLWSSTAARGRLGLEPDSDGATPILGRLDGPSRAALRGGAAEALETRRPIAVEINGHRGEVRAADSATEPLFVVTLAADAGEAEERYRLAMDGADLGLWDWHVPSNALVVDDRYARMLGYTPGELEPHIATWERLIHPDDAAAVREAVQAHFEGRTTRYETTHRVRHRDGSYRWVLDRGRVTRWSLSGAPQRMVGTHHDVTDRVRLAERLRLSEERLRLAVDASEGGLWDWHVPSGGFFLSGGLLGLLGYGPEAVPRSPRNALALVHAEDVHGLRRAARAHLLGKTDSYRARFRARAHDGSLRWFAVSGRVVTRTPGGRPVRVVGVCSCVDEIMSAQEQLAGALDEAQAASRAKSGFLANMSHEIRTPLTAILGYTDLLAEPGVTETDRLDWVKTIDRNGKHLLTLLDDLLDLSKIESGRLRVERMAVSPEQLVREVARLHHARAAAKGVELSVIFRTDLPEQIQTDPTRLRQILSNLVSNAVKFTEHGSVTVEVASENGGGRKLIVEVVDTGVGIKESSRKRLFNAFAQADESMTRRFGGTGLGLAISTRLAGLLGGELRLVESMPGVGSRFRLVVPTAPADGLSQPNPSGEDQPGAHAAAGEAPGGAVRRDPAASSANAVLGSSRTAASERVPSRVTGSAQESAGVPAGPDPRRPTEGVGGPGDNAGGDAGREAPDAPPGRASRGEVEPKPLSQSRWVIPPRHGDG